MVRAVLARVGASVRDLLPWAGPGPRVTPPGAAGIAFAHGLAFTLVAHCQLVVSSPNRIAWFVAELTLALLFWPAARWAAGRVWGVLADGPRSAVWLSVAFGLGLAVWWHGQLGDTLWRHTATARAVLHVLLFFAYWVVGSGVFAAVVAALIATDPDPAPQEPPTEPPARPRWRAVAAVFVLSLVAANAFAVWFVNQEKTLYFVDFAAYWTWTADWVAMSQRSPAEGWDRFCHSVQCEGYGLLPATVPGAAMAAFGDHRLVFVLAVVNGYLLAVWAAAVAFVARFAPRSGWLAAAVPAVILLTMPMAWGPVLRGFLDVGGVALAILALVVYLGRPRGELRWRRLLLTAGLLVALSLFRRWYNFWVVAFVLVAGAEAGLAALGCAARGRWRDAVRALRPPVAVAGLFGLFLLEVAFPLVMLTATTDYAAAYYGYKSIEPFSVRVWKAVDHVGPGYFLAAALALAYLLTRPDARRAALFTAAMVPVIVAHFLRVQDFNAHHLYLLLPALLVLPATAAPRLLRRLPRWAGGAALTAVAVVGVALMAAVVDPDYEWVRSFLRPLAPSAEYRPFARSDLPELRRMLRWVDDETARTGERFVVVSSSNNLHPTMFWSAERSLREPFPAEARRLDTAEVDRVTGFPAGLFRAGLVLVASPPQTHLRAAEQQTILVPTRCLLDGTGVGRAFDKLPVEFHLRNGVTVYAYRRARPIDPADFAAFCEELRQAHPDWPSVFTPPGDPAELLAVPPRR